MRLGQRPEAAASRHTMLVKPFPGPTTMADDCFVEAGLIWNIVGRLGRSTRGILCSIGLLWPISTQAQTSAQAAHTSSNLTAHVAGSFMCRNSDAGTAFAVKFGTLHAQRSDKYPNGFDKAFVQLKYQLPNMKMLEQLTHAPELGEADNYVDGVTESVCFNACGPFGSSQGFSNHIGKNIVTIDGSKVFFTENLQYYDGRYNVLNTDTGRLTFADPSLGILHCDAQESPTQPSPPDNAARDPDDASPH